MSHYRTVTGGAAQLPSTPSGLPFTRDDVLDLIDTLLAEAPTEAADIAAELSAIVSEHRDARRTERPGAEEGGCR